MPSRKLGTVVRATERRVFVMMWKRLGRVGACPSHPRALAGGGTHFESQWRRACGGLTHLTLSCQCARESISGTLEKSIFVTAFCRVHASDFLRHLRRMGDCVRMGAGKAIFCYSGSPLNGGELSFALGFICTTGAGVNKGTFCGG